MKILGYKRLDGKVGFRNHVLIIPTCACSSETCRMITKIVPSTIAMIHQNGCGEVYESTKITRNILAGYAANPNVYGSVVIGLGCEQNNIDTLIEEIKHRTSKPLGRFVIQEEGGTTNTIQKASFYAQELVREASLCTRKKVDISDIILGTECGGSDTTSGIAANPALGNVCDKIINLGATAILTETTELIGAEHILAKRAINDKIRNKILKIVKDYEKHLKLSGQDLRRGQPGPGNKKGGITTLEEKSLGSIHKSGTKPIKDVIEYGEEIIEKGLIIMDAPAYDPASITGLVAGGCQVIIFTTGRGTPIGNGIVPVIKITGNQDTFQKMRDNIDMDVSSVLTGHKTIADMGNEIFKEMIDVLNGKITKAEALGFNDVAIMKRICNYI